MRNFAATGRWLDRGPKDQGREGGRAASVSSRHAGKIYGRTSPREGGLMSSRTQHKVINLRVTAADIKKGKRLDPFACPIIHAAKRKRLGVYCVNHTALYRRGTFAIPTTLQMQIFINDFDHGKKVKPQTFKIEMGL